MLRRSFSAFFFPLYKLKQVFSFLHLTEVDPVCPYAKMNFRKRVVVTDSQHTDLLLLKEHCILNEVKQCNLIMLPQKHQLLL